MDRPQKRPYRKSLASPGFIYLEGKERPITIENISITGAFAKLEDHSDLEKAFKALSTATVLDLYLPELQLVGEAEVVRVENRGNHISLAIKFKQLIHNIDQKLRRRKAYRKNVAITGEIFLYGHYHGFVSVNVSTGGMMIRLANPLNADKGTIADFKFNQSDFKGEIKIAWVNQVEDVGTWMGVQYINMKKDAIKGIPKFNLC